MLLCGEPIGEQMPIRSVGTLHIAGVEVNGAKDPAMEATSERKSADRPDASGEAPTKSESIWLITQNRIADGLRQVLIHSISDDEIKFG